MKRILLVTRPTLDASGYYRYLLPYRHCQKALAGEGIELVISPIVKMDEPFDAIVASRELPLELLRHVAHRQRKTGLRFAWDIDDDFWSVPEWSSAHYTSADLEAFDLSLLVANEVWCSTLPLANKVARLSARPIVRTLPNLLDLSDWGGGWDHPQTAKGEPIRYLWAGSSTHSRDVQTIANCIIEFAKQHRSGAHFHFAGDVPANIAASLFPNSFTHHPWVPLKDYRALLKSIRPHVVLAPLYDCEFNLSKSNIRWLEGHAAGAVVIAQDCVAYQDASLRIKDQSDWSAHLQWLTYKTIREHWFSEDRKQIQHWTWSNKSYLWTEAFRQLVTTKGW